MADFDISLVPFCAHTRRRFRPTDYGRWAHSTHEDFACVYRHRTPTRAQWAKIYIATSGDEQELEDSRRVLAINKEFLTTLKTQLDADMAQLRGPQASRAPGTQDLIYSWRGVAWPPTGTWQTLRQSGSLSLMSHDELKRYTYVYDGIGAFQDVAKELAVLIDTAGSIAQRSPDGNLRPTDIPDLTAATSQCQGRLAYAARILQIEELGLDKAPRPVVE